MHHISVIYDLLEAQPSEILVMATGPEIFYTARSIDLNSCELNCSFCFEEPVSLDEFGKLGGSLKAY